MNTADRRIALVTGANKGIGLEVARQLGKAGHHVLLGARDEARGREAEKTLRDEGIDVRFVAIDLSNSASLSAAAADIEANEGRIDILVNNAGVAVQGERAGQITQLRIEVCADQAVRHVAQARTLVACARLFDGDDYLVQILIQHGVQQRLLVREILIHRANGHASTLRHACRGEPGDAIGQQNLNRRLVNCRHRRRRARLTWRFAGLECVSGDDWHMRM